MAYKLSNAEGNALHHLAIALRPDWVRNRPGQVWHQRVTDSTFPHAVSFLHTIHALIAYASPQAGMRTPNLFPQSGAHWDTTVPARSQEFLPRCQDHDWEPATTCSACWADVKVGDRPRNMIGKHYRVKHRDR
ncbi:hypothetical protein [Auritidibacter ignavus]|uniref:hypothetical protein n=1 Tax=Auritidibacter ignavus TaxID=678932 RepID=UPI000F03ABCA|nr:hypothetical protein [Auritidibacter ignavus]NIH70504.1 hypothetical protein [Auritidibacter ignavus]RMX23307.1 hypothetical protein DYI20_05425 [Auritidibacter ignavus]